MFKYDNPFFEMVGKMFDMVFLGVLWFIMCLPIITIGASTTAAYYVTFNQLNGRDGYVFRKFFKSFKQNFKQSTMLFLIIAILSSLCFGNMYIINTFITVGIVAENILKGIQLFILLEVWFLFLYGFSILSKIDFTFKGLLITALQIANTNLIASGLSVVIVIGLFFALAYFPVLMLFIGGIYLTLTGLVLKFVIKKYRQDIFDEEIKDEAYVLDENN